MLKYFRPISDIHLDFDFRLNGQFHALPHQFVWHPETLPTDLETALIIAGDIWHAGKFMASGWLECEAPRFHSIIFILGNHDYWGGALDKEPANIREALKAMNLPNVYFLEKESVTIEGVKFVGATLWTNFNKEDPVTMATHNRVMCADVEAITCGFTQHYADKKISAHDLLRDHREARKFIFNEAVKTPDLRKLVVISHMAPSHLSLHEMYKHLYIDNGYYYSDLGNEIADSKIDYWFHGHMHTSFSYQIGETWVICNPRGYSPRAINAAFTDEFIIDIDKEVAA